MKENKTREATVSSIFYPGKEDELNSTVKKFLADAETEQHSPSIILSPHAGYSHCGNLMGKVYKAVSNRKIKRVFVFSRVHREPEKYIFLPSFESFSIPTGEISVDTESIRKLLSFDPVFKTDDIPHTEEHSIEVQLPFIKYLWPKALLVPVLTGYPSLKIAKKLAAALKSVTDNDESDLFVVSSNLSAYDHLKDAEKDTSFFLQLLNEGRWEEFPELLNKRKINACSADIITTMYLLNNSRLKHKVLDFDCGMEKTGDSAKQIFEKRVCFGAISFYN